MMEIKNCHLCNIPIYPGEKRCLIAIHIFPDQDSELLFEDACSDMCPHFDDPCDNMPNFEYDEIQGETFQEVQLVLCKDCQDQFMKNPFVKDNLLFFHKENETKTLH